MKRESSYEFEADLGLSDDKILRKQWPTPLPQNPEETDIIQRMK